MMWIDAVCGLLPMGHVYSEADKHNRRTGPNLAVRTHDAVAPRLILSMDWREEVEGARYEEY